MKTSAHNTNGGSFGGSQSLEALISRAQQRSGLSYETFVRGVTENAFRSLVVWSASDLERLLLACEVLQLSPVGREVYAVQAPDQGGAVLITVGLDGWLRLMDQHPAFDGMRFTESQELEGGVPTWIECTIYRRDRRVATSAKEYLAEARRGSGAWLTHPRRMLRHKALVQCAKLAFALPSVACAIYHEELNQAPEPAKVGPAPSSPDFCSNSHDDASTGSAKGQGQPLGQAHAQDGRERTPAGSGKRGRKNPSHGPSSTQQLLRALASQSPTS